MKILAAAFALVLAATAAALMLAPVGAAPQPATTPDCDDWTQGQTCAANQVLVCTRKGWVCVADGGPIASRACPAGDRPACTAPKVAACENHAWICVGSLARQER